MFISGARERWRRRFVTAEKSAEKHEELRSVRVAVTVNAGILTGYARVTESHGPSYFSIDMITKSESELADVYGTTRVCEDRATVYQYMMGGPRPVMRDRGLRSDRAREGGDHLVAHAHVRAR
jgi:hypothetical protein